MNNLTGKKLKFLLSTHHKTQRDIAAYLDLSNVQITRWINDVRPVPKTHLHKIATFFGLTMEELVAPLSKKDSCLYDMLDNLSRDEKANLIVYLVNSMEGAK